MSDEYGTTEADDFQEVANSDTQDLLNNAPKPQDQGTPDTPPPTADLILFDLLLDESGSMSSLRAEVIKQFNDFIDGLQDYSQSAFGALQLTTLAFDNQVREIHPYKNIEDVPRLTKAEYTPSGGTILRDAMMSLLRVDIDQKIRMQQLDEGMSVRSILCVITDGNDTASKHNTRSDLRQAISDFQFQRDPVAHEAGEQKLNEFYLFGLNQDLTDFGTDIGIPKENIHETEHSGHDLRGIFRLMGTKTLENMGVDPSEAQFG